MGTNLNFQTPQEQTFQDRNVLPKHISPVGVKEEVLLKLPKQGLDKICIGMDVL